MDERAQSPRSGNIFPKSTGVRKHEKNLHDAVREHSAAFCPLCFNTCWIFRQHISVVTDQERRDGRGFSLLRPHV